MKEGGPAGGPPSDILQTLFSGIRDAVTGKAPANASAQERAAASAASMAMMVSGVGDAAAGEEVEEGAVALYKDITRDEFEANLESSGWTKTSPAPSVDQFTKDGAKYDVYTSTSPQGPSAQYTPRGRPSLRSKSG